MDFHSFKDTYTVNRGILDGEKHLKQDFYTGLVADCIRCQNGQGINQIQAEMMWFTQNKPYYRVYPGIYSLLQKVDLERVKCSALRIPRGLKALTLNFAKGYEPVLHGRSVHSIMMCTISLGPKEVVTIGNMDDVIKHAEYYNNHPELVNRGFMLLVDTGDLSTEHGPVYDYIKFCQSDLTIKEEIALVINEQIQAFPEELLKIVTTIMLLDDDPELITRDVLSDDRPRYESGDQDLKLRLEQKAARRGKLGWDVGARIDGQSPHYRHGHMALFWTGAGRKTPKIQWRQGAVVHREKVVTVPSGYGE